MLECPHCHSGFPREWSASVSPFPCPNCARVMEVHVFPAFARSEKTEALAGVRALDGEACCFHHPTKRAMRICDGCGIFICDLCDLDTGKQHLCPTCLEKGQTNKKLTHINNETVLYDGFALGLALAPLTGAFWWIFPISAPAALFFGIRYWKAPRSVVPRDNTRMIIAIVLSVLELLAMVGGILYLVAR